ncbi:MAG: complex I subunit 5 family protein [Hyphomicrobiaceae bacterium]
MTGPSTIIGNSSGGWLLVLALMVPVAGSVLALVAGGRRAERIALVISPIALALGFAIAASVWRTGRPITYHVGSWAPPLGLELRADGLSATLILLTAIIMSATVIFARPDFRASQSGPEKRSSLAFWIYLMGLWGALVGVFLGNDLFNLYVALELLTVTAVPMVCLSGSAETLVAALRYLLFALVGSVLYLLGVALVYGAYGTLDIALLASRFRDEPAVWLAAALMTAGLLAKTALFPLHLWLPAAHAGAPAAASALLSALAVKASFYLTAKVWFDAFPGLLNQASAQVLAALGAGAIIFGGVLALRQVRLKLLIAYSTVAQIGYLFLMFPLIVSADAASWSQLGWMGAGDSSCRTRSPRLRCSWRRG